LDQGRKEVRVIGKVRKVEHPGLLVELCWLGGGCQQELQQGVPGKDIREGWAS